MKNKFQTEAQRVTAETIARNEVRINEVKQHIETIAAQGWRDAKALILDPVNYIGNLDDGATQNIYTVLEFVERMRRTPLSRLKLLCDLLAGGEGSPLDIGEPFDRFRATPVNIRENLLARRDIVENIGKGDFWNTLFD